MNLYDSASAQEAARLLLAAQSAFDAYRSYVLDCGDLYRAPRTDLARMDDLVMIYNDGDLLVTPDVAFARMLTTGNSSPEMLGLTSDPDNLAPEPLPETLDALRVEATKDTAVTITEGMYFAEIEWQDETCSLFGPFTFAEGDTWINGYPEGDDLADIALLEATELKWRYRNYPAIAVNQTDDDFSTSTTTYYVWKV